MMVEFADFKHSKKLHEHIIHINTMEEEADALFISSMHELQDVYKRQLCGSVKHAFMRAEAKEGI